MLQNEKLSGSKEIHELENPVAIIKSDVEAEELDEGSSNVHVWTVIENTRLNNFDSNIRYGQISKILFVFLLFYFLTLEFAETLHFSDFPV